MWPGSCEDVGAGVLRVLDDFSQQVWGSVRPVVATTASSASSIETLRSRFAPVMLAVTRGREVEDFRDSG
jgi:hypothetical protein